MAPEKSTRSAAWPRALEAPSPLAGSPLTDALLLPDPEITGSRRPVPRLLDLAVAVALYASLLFAFFTLIGPVLTARGESEAGIFFGLQVLDDAALAGIAVLFGRLRFPGSWGDLGFRGVGVGWWVTGLGGGVAAAGSAWAASAALGRWGWVAPVHPVESVLEAARTPVDVALVLLAVTVPVPLAEETFFRGFAYRLLSARFGGPAAAGATSLAFALVHGLAPGAWVPVVPVGLVFALLVEKSGSLWPAVVGHAVVNVVAILAQ